VRYFIAMMILATMFVCPVLANVNESIDAGWKFIEPVQVDLWQGNRDVLYDNGPLMNSAGTGVGGADESVVQNVSLGMTLYGFGFQLSAANLMTDDFEIPAGDSWNIEGVTIFGYQTGSTTNSTITGVYFEIRDAMPPGGNVVGGGIANNGLVSSAWTGMYRVLEDTSGQSADRPIMASEASMTPVTLGPGTYWLIFQKDGSLSSGPWAPPITITGEPETGNGMQSVDGGVSYLPALDGVFVQGMPFLIHGTGGTTAATASSWGVVKALY
jgi:hypothetical protein